MDQGADERAEGESGIFQVDLTRCKGVAILSKCSNIGTTNRVRYSFRSNDVGKCDSSVIPERILLGPTS